ncbi:hypothetical protein TNCT_598441 [Trichonephila clavata]|uniref:Uncharacterized protein n=1 Tax=Trichonephila clavata TaxID=2740835 RepID=A0A8X6M0E7_TRICU|nr:hypothetical protein TNCT_598441 [Trichonephila clavata]
MFQGETKVTSFNHCMEFRSKAYFLLGKTFWKLLPVLLPASLMKLFLPVFKVIQVMGVTIRQKSKDYANTVDNARILRVEKTAEATCKEARALHRALKTAENENFEETEGLLYTPGIAD